MTETRDESAARDDPDAGNRRILGLSALEVSGDAGYRNLTAEKIVERSGLDAKAFHSLFDTPAACYASGYVATVDDLMLDLFASADRHPTWALSMRAGLQALAKFVETEPTLARGIILEVYIAGGIAAAKRDEVFERLSRAVDSARRENASRHSPPPIASRFILNMIEAQVGKWLQEDDPAPLKDAVPDLLYVAATFYFGREEAERLME